MDYKRLFIWVEGEDDKRFFQTILEPKLQEKYDLVETRCYATLKKEKVDKFLKSIKAMGADYIYVTDINNSPCITAKIHEKLKKYRHVEDDKIIVVIKEIESWYLAGLTDVNVNKFRIHPFNDTDTITKEQFKKLIPGLFSSRIDFMLEILKVFSIEVAKHKNKSFRYFIEKCNC
jgi:hypothetical protein